MGKLGSHTFVRGYSKEQIMELLSGYELDILRMFRTCDSYMVIGQK